MHATPWMVKNAWVAPWKLRFHGPADKGVVADLEAAAVVAVSVAPIVVEAQASEIADPVDSETVVQVAQDAITMAAQAVAVSTVVMTSAPEAALVSEVETDSDLAVVAAATAADPLKAKVVQDASKSLPLTHIRPQI